MSVSKIHVALTAVLTAVLLATLTGCALETTASLSPDAVPGTAISGTVHGGQQIITGAKVYLLAVNPTGYGGPGIAASTSNASISLLKASSTGNAADSIGSYVLTTATGFSLTNDYSCTAGFAQSTGTAVTLPGTGAEQVYLYIVGGKAANIASANTSSGLLVALGPCTSPTAHVAANEMTTAATAYAFAGFATDALHIGSSGSALALTNLANAFANVANLATVSTGAATATTTTITRPIANINSIANIFAACVDGLTGNSNCTTLFQYTRSSGATGTAPTNTATAAINLAHNPWPTDAGLTALFGLGAATGAPFQPTLSAQPTDFTLALTTTSGVNQTFELAIDSTGSVWTANSGNNTLTKYPSSFTPTAAITATGNYLGGVANIAVDSTNRVWAVIPAGSIVHVASNGSVLTQSNTNPGGGLNDPVGISIDGSGNLWVANYGNSSISEFDSTGSAKSPSTGYTGGGLSGSWTTAIDVSGNVWVGNYSLSKGLSEFSSTGVAISTSSSYTGGGINVATGVAIDGSGNVWTANNNANSLSEFNTTGTAISSSTGYTGAGLMNPGNVAIDSAGNVWAANGSANSISVVSNTGVAISGPSGYTSGGYTQAYDVAIDGSGNVWVTNNTGSSTGNALIEVIGAAAPVVTPVTANLSAPYGTATVNRP